MLSCLTEFTHRGSKYQVRMCSGYGVVINPSGAKVCLFRYDGPTKWAHVSGRANVFKPACAAIEAVWEAQAQTDPA